MRTEVEPQEASAEELAAHFAANGLIGCRCSWSREAGQWVRVKSTFLCPIYHSRGWS